MRVWPVRYGPGRIFGHKRPGGAAAPFVPTDVSGCVLWLRADLGVTDAGAGAVSAWADQSGAGHNLSQSTSGSRPVYTASIINGQPVIRFTSGGDKFLNFTTPWTQPAIWTLYAVVKYVTNGSDYQIFMQTTGSAVQCKPYLGYNAGNVNKPLAYGAGNDAIWGSALTAGNYVIRWRCNYSTDINNVRVGNGTEINSSGSSNLIAGTWDKLGLGLGVQELRSDVAEIIMYNKAPSAGEDSSVLSYFNTRYGV